MNNEASATSSENKHENYYVVLGCSEQATLSELRQCYKALIKKYHPDKQQGLSDDQFILIDKAFKVLKDVNLRKEYDASLLEKNFNKNSLIYAKLSKEELSFVDGEAKFLCRCGENIVIEKYFLDEEECIIECSECTNCISIM